MCICGVTLMSRDRVDYQDVQGRIRARRAPALAIVTRKGRDRLRARFAEGE